MALDRPSNQFTINEILETGIVTTPFSYMSAMRLRKRYNNNKSMDNTHITRIFKDISDYIKSAPQIRNKYPDENKHILEAASRFLTTIKKNEHKVYDIDDCELLALAWLAILDTNVLTDENRKKSPELVEKLKKDFILSLMEGQRNYNKNKDLSISPYYDKSGNQFEPDKPSCPAGISAKCLEAIDLKHPDVNLHYATPPNLTRAGTMDLKEVKVSLADMGDAAISLMVIQFDSLKSVEDKINIIKYINSRDFDDLSYDDLCDRIKVDDNYNLLFSNKFNESFAKFLTHLSKNLIEIYGIYGKNVERESGLTNEQLRQIIIGVVDSSKDKLATLADKLATLANDIGYTKHQDLFFAKSLSKDKTNTSSNKLFNSTKFVRNQDQPAYLLAEAIHNNDADKIEFLIKTYQVNELQDLNYQDGNFHPALHIACEEGKLTIVKSLLDKGFDVNLKNRNGGYRVPLSYALENNHEEIAQLLIDRKADLGVSDNFGKSPFDYNQNKSSQYKL